MKNSVTLTSKNQLTMPVAVARQLKLKPGSRLDYSVKNGSVTFKPQPTVAQRLEVMWAENARVNKGVASDASIKESVREYYRHKKV